MARTALLDIDGTLVDTNYHHVIAWARAFARFGHRPPLWRIHRTIGMAGDLLVAEVCGDEVEKRDGEALREAEDEEWRKLVDEVRPLDGARELVVALKDAGWTVILASSAKPWETEHYVGLLDADGIVDGATDSGDVETAKPEPDIVNGALEKAGAKAQDAVFVGDSRWDCEAAQNAGVACRALLTGGYSEAELREAGAMEVHHDLVSMREALLAESDGG